VSEGERIEMGEGREDFSRSGEPDVHDGVLSMLDTIWREEEDPEPVGNSLPPSLRGNKDLRLLIGFCRQMLLYGATSSFLHTKLERLATQAGVGASFIITPSFIFVSVEESPSYIIPCVSGWNLHKLQIVDGIMERILGGSLGMEEGYEQMMAVSRTKTSSAYESLRLFCFLLLSASASALFFNGTWADALCSGVLGYSVGIMYTMAQKLSHRSRRREMFFYECVIAIITAFATTLISNLFHALNYPAIVLSAVIWLLPGIPMMMAVLELANRLVFEGTFRLVNAGLLAVAIGYGITVGSHAAKAFVVHEIDVDFGAREANRYPILYCVVHGFANCVLVRAPSRQWIPLTLMGVVAQQLNSMLIESAHMGGEAATLFSTILIGVMANGYSHFSGVTPLVYIVNALSFLVPGAIGLRGVLDMLDYDVVHGITFAGQFFSLATSITIGLMLSNVITLPVKYIAPKQPRDRSPSSQADHDHFHNITPRIALGYGAAATFLLVLSLYPDIQPFSISEVEVQGNLAV